MKKHAAKTTAPLTVAKNPLAEAVGSVKEFSGVRVETEQRSENNSDFNGSSDVATMSSREIATATGKLHKNVKRDIENMFKKLKINSLKFEHSYETPMPRGGVKKQTEYLLPRRECEILITGYDVLRRAAVIDRWHELESGKAKPLCQVKKKQKKEPVSDDLNWDRVQAFKPGTISRLTEVFDEAMELGERLYEDREQRVLYANAATEKLTGINCLALGDASIEGDTGSTYQPAPHMDRSYSAGGRQMTRKKGQYNLQSLYSLSELCNESGKSHSFIKNTLLSDGVMVRLTVITTQSP